MQQWSKAHIKISQGIASEKTNQSPGTVHSEPLQWRKKAVHKRSPRSLKELELFCKEKWDKISKSRTVKLIETYSQRCCNKGKGYFHRVLVGRGVQIYAIKLWRVFLFRFPLDFFFLGCRIKDVTKSNIYVVVISIFIFWKPEIPQGCVYFFISTVNPGIYTC